MTRRALPLSLPPSSSYLNPPTGPLLVSCLLSQISVAHTYNTLVWRLMLWGHRWGMGDNTIKPQYQRKVAISPSVSVCVCMNMNVCRVHTSLYVHACVDQRSTLGVIPQAWVILFFESGSFTGTWGSLIRQGCLDTTGVHLSSLLTVENTTVSSHPTL